MTAATVFQYQHLANRPGNIPSIRNTAVFSDFGIPILSTPAGYGCFNVGDDTDLPCRRARACITANVNCCPSVRPSVLRRSYRTVHWLFSVDSIQSNELIAEPTIQLHTTTAPADLIRKAHYNAWNEVKQI